MQVLVKGISPEELYGKLQEVDVTSTVYPSRTIASEEDGRDFVKRERNLPKGIVTLFKAKNGTFVDISAADKHSQSAAWKMLQRMIKEEFFEGSVLTVTGESINDIRNLKDRIGTALTVEKKNSILVQFYSTKGRKIAAKVNLYGIREKIVLEPRFGFQPVIFTVSGGSFKKVKLNSLRELYGKDVFLLVNDLILFLTSKFV